MASVADRAPDETRRAVPEPAVPWAAILWFGALILLCYWPVLKRLVLQWYNDEDMGHGFFVPLVAAYIFWQRRDDLFRPLWKPNYWGLAILAYAVLQLLLGTLGAELFLQRTAFLLTLVGAIVLLGGFPALKKSAFPLALLLFMIPLPAIIYNQITFKLQLFASRVAESTLMLFNTPVVRDGNILELANQRLNVVEACSGIRSLLSLGFLSLVYAYFFDAKPWMRWALLAAAIPIAVIANSGRVTITGFLSEYNPELARGFLHMLEGWIIFIVAVVLMIITHRILNAVYSAAHGRHERTFATPK
jgi:exosortase